MKKIVLVEAKTIQAVEEFAAGLENTEALVDRILKAARLERTQRQHMSNDNLTTLVVGGCVLLLIFMAFSCIALNIIF